MLALTNFDPHLQRRLLAVRRERRRILAHEWDLLEDQIMEAEKRDFRIRSSGISSFEKKRLDAENKDRKKIKMKPGIPYGQAAELAERDPYAVHRRAELSVKSLMRTDRKARARLLCHRFEYEPASSGIPIPTANADGGASI